MIFAKKILILFLAVFMLLSLNSCHNGKSEFLYVTSTDYVNIDKIEIGSLNDLNVGDAFKSDEYDAFQCFVSKTNEYGDQPERLVVNNERAPHIYSCYGSNGYFVGSDYTEFAAGISFFTYTGVADNGGDALPTGRCIALLDCFETNKDYCYAVTSWNYVDPDGNFISVYRLDYPKEDNEYRYSATKVCDVVSDDNAVAAVITNTNTIYVATDRALYSVSTEGNISQIDVPDKWQYLLVNSMVYIGESLYIGTKYGILLYDTGNRNFSWFPVDYNKILPNRCLEN